jgi:hypothetical protein
MIRQWIARLVIVALVWSSVPVSAQYHPQDTPATPLVLPVRFLMPVGAPPDVWAEPVAPIKYSQMFSENLLFGGLIAVVVGLANMGTLGDDYRFLGHHYCVQAYSVDEGSCARGLSPKWGLIIIGGGALAMYVGSRKVWVTPHADKNALGASATVAWGQ